MQESALKWKKMTQKNLEILCFLMSYLVLFSDFPKIILRGVARFFQFRPTPFARTQGKIASPIWLGCPCSNIVLSLQALADGASWYITPHYLCENCIRLLNNHHENNFIFVLWTPMSYYHWNWPLVWQVTQFQIIQWLDEFKKHTQYCLSVEGKPPATRIQRHAFWLPWLWPWPRAGVRQLAALLIVFKSESSSRDPWVCPPENFWNSSML